MHTNPLTTLVNLLQEWGFTAFWADLLIRIAAVTVVIFLAWAVWWLTDRVVIRLLRNVVKRTRITWDDELLERKLFHRLAWLAPAIILRALANTYFEAEWWMVGFATRVADLVIIAAVSLAINDLLGFFNALYARRPDAGRRPLKGIIQAFQVIVLTSAVIIAFAEVTGREVSGLMAGLGAISAVLMIIFQDPLKGLVAGFQISSNDMVRIGDWIEMPSQGADGDVIDISLLNVTVRNWDKTYVTFPIQSLTTGAFKNWRGMSESGGRRIKRSVRIDMSSIRFLDEQEVERLTSVALLRDYLTERREEIRQWNEEHGQDRAVSPVNGRALTNIGVFRAYAKAYVTAHPKSNTGMTLLVRQLQSGPDGLPIEIYLFSTDKAWTDYEDLQSDIFDHLLAILPDFGLRAFQHPSGSDMRRFAEGSGRAD